MTRLFLLEYPLTSLSVLGDFCRTPLQTIRYTYDPVGNITQIYDESQKKVFTNNQGVAPEQNYVYDSLYRLLEATGREHNALSVPDYYKHTSSFKQSQFTNINDASQLSNYTRHFEYDKSGNLTQIQHVGNSSFTREIAVDSQTNRAILRETTNPIDFNQFFDPNGNCTQLENIAKLAWNYRDNISRAIIIERTSEPDDAEYYVYDAKGARVRKIKETYKGEGVIEIEEKVYLGSVEIKRIYQNTTPILERSTLHVLDDKRRIAIAHNWTQDDLQREVDSADLNTNKLRYQYENHLGSSSLELNSHGQIISYEEYFPYGGTSFIAGTSQREVKLKEYRYSAKERDDTTGLYYYGFRYYAPWLGRWVSADPKGQEGSEINMYWYASSNPINRVDEDGRKDRQFDMQISTPSSREGFNIGAGADASVARNIESMTAKDDISEVGFHAHPKPSGDKFDSLYTSDLKEPGVLRVENESNVDRIASNKTPESKGILGVDTQVSFANSVTLEMAGQSIEKSAAQTLNIANAVYKSSSNRLQVLEAQKANLINKNEISAANKLIRPIMKAESKLATQTAAKTAAQATNIGAKVFSKVGLPVAGVGLDVLVDQHFNPQHSLKRSIIPSVAGAVAGIAVGSALAPTLVSVLLVGIVSVGVGTGVGKIMDFLNGGRK